MNERHVKFATEHPKLAGIYMDIGAVTAVTTVAYAACGVGYLLGYYVVGPAVSTVKKKIEERRNKKKFFEKEIWDDLEVEEKV